MHQLGKFYNSQFIPYIPDRFLTYDDVVLLPQHSDIPSRNDPSINLKTRLTQSVPMTIPLVSANMDTITGADMALALASKGGYGILHRFYDTKESWWSDIEKVYRQTKMVAFSIGLAPEDILLVQEVLDLAGHAIVCIDVAHGHTQMMAEQIRRLRIKYGNNIQIISGNVATPTGVQTLVQAGTDAVKVGIGPGSLCTTRVVTGHGIPQLTAILAARATLHGMRSNATIIADGGIRNSGDIVKALGAGADSVMIGNLFAATDETPGELEIDPLYDNTLDNYTLEQIKERFSSALCKRYRGQSSQHFLDSIEKVGVAPEGEDKQIDYKGSVIPIIDNLLQGIRSGLTYSGCRSLQEFYDKAMFIEISTAAYIEGTPHGLNY